jgi:hypothetical protein
VHIGYEGTKCNAEDVQLRRGLAFGRPKLVAVSPRLTMNVGLPLPKKQPEPYTAPATSGASDKSNRFIKRHVVL